VIRIKSGKSGFYTDRPKHSWADEMTDEGAHPASIRFDEAKSFSDNCRTFLASLETIDADMAIILRDNWATLIAVVREGERDSKARGEFNSKVASALDSLLKPAKPNGGA